MTNLLIEKKCTLLEGDLSVKNDIDLLESEIRAMNLSRFKSCQIRSRAQWLEEGEKPTKFFLNLEATCAQKNMVKSIFNSDGVEVSSQKEIEQAHFEFYQQLYSKMDIDAEVQTEILNRFFGM